MTRKTILAVDGNSILNRAFYGVKPLSTTDGRPTNALFGFVNIIMKAYDSLKPDGVVVAFDLKAPTFRHKECDFYKANRHGMPDDLAAQLEPAKEIVRAFGFHAKEIAGFEADDILGTCAENAKKSTDVDYDCYILTGDRDSFQLVGDKCYVLLAGNNDTVTYDTQAIIDKYGLTPDKLIDLKALMGDTSDNIPGVAGIGEKTAIKLIERFGSLDGLYAEYESSDLSAGVKTKLANGREMAYKSRFLAEIYTSVPLELTYNDVVNSKPDKKELYRIFSDLELKSFIKRFALDGENTPAYDNQDSQAKACNTFVAAELAQGIPSGEKLYVYPDFEENTLFIKQQGDDKLYKTEITDKTLEEVFCDKSKKTTLYNSKEVCLKLISIGKMLENCVDDLMLLSYTADPQEKHEPSALFERHTACILPDKEVSQALCLAMSEIAEKLTQKVSENGSLELYREIELPLAIVLAKMQTRGMKLDTAGLSEYGKKIDARLNERKQNIYALSGEEFNVNSPKQLGEILFNRLGLKGMKKTKSGFSTDAETLERLRPYHPIINEILDFRLVSKLRSTYVEGLLGAVDNQDRLHTNFKQALTLTGRLSSAEPNLQNIPIRKQEGRELRRFFIPENKDSVLIDADYSQIELRILAAVSEDETMINAFCNGIDIHTVTASQVFGLPIEMINSELRKKAKAVNFGIVYGISDFSLAGDLGISIKEAGDYIKSYFSKYPKVEQYLKNAVENAQQNGYVTTLYGRRRYIPELTSQKKPLQSFGKRVAMNSPIQGTAADIIKIAMLKAENALEKAGLDARLILQVHDELIVESSRKHAEMAGEILRHEMENAVKLAVPLEVDLHIADNWFDAHG